MLLTEYRVSERRACAIVLLERTVYRYVGRPRDDRAVRQRIKEIATTRVRYGFERIQVLLRREGWRDNHKRAYRIYKEEGLNLRSKRPRRNKAAAHRQERPLLTGPHQCWSMDFVSDQLFDGRRFRALTLLGHSDVRVTMRYVRSVETRKRVAVEAARLNSGKVGHVLASWPKQPATALAVNH